ncbi:MAG: hypothetical protein ABIY70_08840 [Capsulimonas sp.]|uniref:hypothetical protein n=1 Tax=Capsulimonas sp. TaxID=2494211 RepID=UPI003267D080
MTIPQNDNCNTVSSEKRAFDPNRHLITVQGGRKYLPVSARVLWFRAEHPDWTIETNPLTIDNDKQFAIFQAKIFDADGRLMAMGTKKEDIKGFGDYIEKAETGAVGRALALCGYGTQFAPELDEVAGGRLADAPGNGRGQRPNQSGQRGGGHPAARPSSEFPRPRAEAPASSEPADEQALPTTCSSCPKPINKSQCELSIRNYGAALCPACQKDGRDRAITPTQSFRTAGAASVREGAGS